MVRDELMAFPAAARFGSQQPENEIQWRRLLLWMCVQSRQGSKPANHLLTDLKYSIEQDVTGNISYLQFNTY